MSCLELFEKIDFSKYSCPYVEFPLDFLEPNVNNYYNNISIKDSRKRNIASTYVPEGNVVYYTEQAVGDFISSRFGYTKISYLEKFAQLFLNSICKYDECRNFQTKPNTLILAHLTWDADKNYCEPCFLCLDNRSVLPVQSKMVVTGNRLFVNNELYQFI